MAQHHYKGYAVSCEIACAHVAFRRTGSRRDALPRGPSGKVQRLRLRDEGPAD